MQGNNVAVMDIYDFAIGSDVSQDMADHYSIIMLRSLRRVRQVLGLVTLGQVSHGRRETPLPPLVGRILAAIDPLPNFPCFGTSSRDRPIRPRADPKSMLRAVAPIGQQEGSGAIRGSFAWREHPQREASQVRIPNEP
jgi:hypothetical protein